jgi:O-antigen/teichoic acid export membrane protein
MAGALTSSRTLGRNMGWNLLGMGLPTLIALVSIPVLIGWMGEERFGVLLLVWLVFGYLSIFDLGLHRALTQLVARALGEGRSYDIAPMFWTALALMVMAGTAGGGAVAMLSEPLVHGWLRVPAELLEETYWAFVIMALALPVLVSTAALRGFVEAHQRFGMVFVVQMLRGVWTFAGPLAVVALFGSNLVVVVLGLLLGRLVAWALLFGMCVRVHPDLLHRVRLSGRVVRPLLSYGGWMALAHTVVPVVLFADRMVIGGLISLEAVTYYTTPSEVVVKLLLVPQAVVGVLFPAFAATYRTDLLHTRRLFRTGLKLVYLSFLPVAIVGIALAPEALRLWLGHTFEQQSTLVLQLLMIGVFLNGSGILLSALVQGVGRPQISALLYCAELPVFFALMWWLTQAYGIEGTALAWAARHAVDALVLLLFARRLLHETFLTLVKQIGLASLAILGLVSLIALEGLGLRLAVSATMILILAVTGWSVLLTHTERAWVQTTLRRGTSMPHAPREAVHVGTGEDKPTGTRGHVALGPTSDDQGR